MGKTDDESADSFHAAYHSLKNPLVTFLSKILFRKRVFLNKKSLGIILKTVFFSVNSSIV